MIELEIWQPRYSQGDCLVLASKVKGNDELHEIWFSKAKHLAGHRYHMTGWEIREMGNVTTPKSEAKVCYSIPMVVLEKFRYE